MYHLTFEG